MTFPIKAKFVGQREGNRGYTEMTFAADGSIPDFGEEVLIVPLSVVAQIHAMHEKARDDFDYQAEGAFIEVLELLGEET